MESFQEKFEFVLAHSPMLRDMEPLAARQLLASKHPGFINDTYENLMLQVHVGAVAKADEPNVAPDLAQVDPIYYTVTKKENG